MAQQQEQYAINDGNINKQANTQRTYQHRNRDKLKNMVTVQ